MRDARDFDSDRLQQLSQIQGGGVTFNRRIGCDDDFFYGLIVEPFEKLSDFQLIRSDAVDGADETMENVVQTTVVVEAFYRHDISRLADDAEDRFVASNIAADLALLVFRDVLAAGAELEFLLRGNNRICQSTCLVYWNSEQMISEALGRFRTNAWKFFKLGNELAKGLGEQQG